MKKQKKAALILVDLQKDFCLGGSLTVPGGDEVVPIANQLASHFHQIIATQDWHPADHKSFASNQPGHKPGDEIMLHGLAQTLWPDHCIQHSAGAALHPKLNKTAIDKIVLKGVDSEIDSYSAFFDNEHLRSTGLADYLRANDIQTIYIMGLATDYCVKYSCLDAAKLGFDIYVIQDGCRGIELHPGDIDKAFEEMRAAGVKLINSNEVPRQLE